MKYSSCRRCGSVLLPGGDLCGKCSMPPDLRGDRVQISDSPTMQRALVEAFGEDDD